jgi:hypothetical protein
VVAEIQSMFSANMSGFVANSLAAVIGLLVTIAAVATHGPLLGVGAAPLAFPAFIIGAPLAAIGGFAAVRYYRRVTAGTKREFHTRIDQLQTSYHSALEELTQKERNRLTQYGNQVLTPIFSRLEVLAKRYTEQLAAFDTFQQQIDQLRKKIQDSR